MTHIRISICFNKTLRVLEILVSLTFVICTLYNIGVSIFEFAFFLSKYSKNMFDVVSTFGNFASTTVATTLYN